MSAKMSEADYATFQKLAASHLRELGLLENEDAFAIDADLDKFESWLEKRGEVADHLNVRFDLFKRWVQYWRGMPQRINSEITLHVSVTRNYGPVTVSYGETSTWEIATRGEYVKAMQTLTNSLWEVHNDWLREQGSKLGVTGNGAQTTTTTSASEMVRASQLTHEVQNGKHRFRIKGSKYSEYGVPIYAEVLAQVGYDKPETQVPFEGITFEGMMTVELENGKPKRVTAVTGL